MALKIHCIETLTYVLTHLKLSHITSLYLSNTYTDIPLGVPPKEEEEEEEEEEKEEEEEEETGVIC